MKGETMFSNMQSTPKERRNWANSLAVMCIALGLFISISIMLWVQSSFNASDSYLGSLNTLLHTIFDQVRTQFNL